MTSTKNLKSEVSDQILMVEQNNLLVILQINFTTLNRQNFDVKLYIFYSMKRQRAWHTALPYINSRLFKNGHCVSISE